MNSTQPRKIAFFGTPDFTVDFLTMLSENNFRPSLIITNPDSPVGRGLTMRSPLPKVWGNEHEITVLQPEKLDDAFFETLQTTKWDLFIVIAYGKIIPERVINLSTFGTINLHYSLLPKYRGATPVESAILHGDPVTGITFQQMQFKLDTGPILLQKEFPIEPTDTTLTLRHRLNQEALLFFPAVLRNIFNKTIVPIEQIEEHASHCKKIAKEDGEISLDEDDAVLDRKYRAYMPWPGLYFFVTKHEKQIRVKINEAIFEDNKFKILFVTPEGGKPQPFDIFMQNIK
jgi:methionyl-tRNA formyltransferase